MKYFGQRLSGSHILTRKLVTLTTYRPAFRFFPLSSANDSSQRADLGSEPCAPLLRRIVSFEARGKILLSVVSSIWHRLYVAVARFDRFPLP